MGVAQRLKESPSKPSGGGVASRLNAAKSVQTVQRLADPTVSVDALEQEKLQQIQQLPETTYRPSAPPIEPEKPGFLQTALDIISRPKQVGQAALDIVGRPSEIIAEYATPDAPIIGGPQDGMNARQAFLERTGQRPAEGFAEKALGTVIAPFAVPGAGLGTARELYQAAGPLASKLTSRISLPAGQEASKLVSRIRSPLTQNVASEALREAAVGGAVGVGQEYAQGSGNAKDALVSGAFGTGIGAVTGAIGPLVKGGLQAGVQSLKNTIARTEANQARAISEVGRESLPSNVKRFANDEPVQAVTPEPTNIDELVKSRGYPDATPENIAQTYNTKNWYHGTGTDKLTKDSLDPFVGSHESLFGQGVYLTDNPTIAEGYAKSRGKRGVPTTYESNVAVNRVLDLEKPITPDVYAAIDKTVKPLDYQYEVNIGEPNYFTNMIRSEADKGATPEQIITKLREEVKGLSKEAGIPTSEFVSDFQDLAVNLKQAGYDGLTHTGGARTGNDAHRVLILLDPQNVHGGTAGPKQVTRLEKYTPPLPASKTPAILKPAPRINGTAQAYAGNAIQFRQAAVQNEREISRNQVVNNIRKNLDVVIDTGRLSSKGRGVLGEFKVTPEVTRTRMQGDIQTIAHEVGHNLDKRFKLNQPAYQNELISMVNQANPGHLANYKAAQHMDEAIAEYVRLRMTDPQQARQLAPNFTAFFDKQLSPKMLKGLEASAKDIDTWITQGEYNQAKGLIDFESGSKKDGFNWSKTYAKFVDDLSFLKIAEKALKGVVGLGKDSIYKMARLSRGMEEKAKLAVTRGIYDAKGNKISEGLSEIVKPLEKIGIKEKDFALYLAIKHAVDLKALGKQVPFTDGHIKAVLARLDTPEVQAVQQGIIKYNNALLDTLVDAQILSPKAVSEMRQKYPNYVPFMRYFDDDAVAGFKNGGFGSAKGFANVTNPIKRMSEEGSLKDIINPVESIVKNTFLVMNAAAKNKVGLQLADLSKINGAGAWVEHVGKGGASPHEHIISVFVNGERQSYKIREPELYNAMLSLDTESTNSLIKFLGGTASLLRAGATLTPEFMIRNAFRDVAGAMVNSTKYGFNPLDFFKGMFHVLGKTKSFDEFLSSGGAMGTMAALDRDANREALKMVFRQSLKDKALNVVTSPKELAKMLTLYTPVKKTVGLLRKGAEISELSTKVGLYNKTLKKTGSMEEAAYTARDIMDFNRAGSAIRPANKAIAFLNASIQGTDRMVRSFKDNPAGFLVRSFTTLVLPSIGLYYWANSLDAEKKKLYDNIPQWQKDSFFIVPVPGSNEFLRIPKPFEAGMLFSTGTDRLMRWFADHDPEASKEYGASLLQAFTPPMLITALTPLLEALTNHSLFRNAPIVPMSEQRFEKKDQYGLYTSETSKLIGNLVAKTPYKDTNAASPRIIDNTIKGYTAGLGQYAVAGVDSAIRGISGKEKAPLPAKTLTEQPFLRSFFASTSGGGQVRQDFYDKWDELSKKKASADRNEQTFQDPDYLRMKQSYNDIGKIMKVYKTVQTDKQMDPATKRTKLDELDTQMNVIAAKGLGK